ncbi:hypothetical protein [Desulfotomaculum defluvii]
MGGIKVWEKYANDGLDFDSEEEREMANRFNKSFLKLLKALPKTKRRDLFNMLHSADDLYRHYGIKCYEDGINSGLNIAIEKLSVTRLARG